MNNYIILISEQSPSIFEKYDFIQTLSQILKCLRPILVILKETNQLKSKKLSHDTLRFMFDEVWAKIQFEWTEKAEIRKATFLAVGEAYEAIVL